MSIGSLKFSDYIVYVDESGDHSLTTVDPRYPVFVLSFCIFQKAVYTDLVIPAVRRLKFATFGHDMVIFHEHDIRKKEGAFRLLSKEPRDVFLTQLTDLLDSLEFTLVVVVIDKSKLNVPDFSPFSVYHFAMQLGIETLYHFFVSREQDALLTHIVFESRGKTEDCALVNEFQRVCNGGNSMLRVFPFEIVMADKKANSEGLQFADMTARPVGLTVLRPNQPNRTVEVLRKKLFCSSSGEIEGYGLHLHPPISERPQGFPWSLTPAG